VFEGSTADLRANAYIRKEWLEVRAIQSKTNDRTISRNTHERRV